MAQPKSITVKFHEAYLAKNQPDSACFGAAIVMPSLFRPPFFKATFMASNAAEVVKHVEALALDEARSCVAFVHMTNRTDRKFPGFDKAVRDLYFNLTPEPVTA